MAISILENVSIVRILSGVKTFALSYFVALPPGGVGRDCSREIE
jgi:hypothetical protein